MRPRYKIIQNLLNFWRRISLIYGILSRALNNIKHFLSLFVSRALIPGNNGIQYSCPGVPNTRGKSGIVVSGMLRQHSRCFHESLPFATDCRRKYEEWASCCTCLSYSCGTCACWADPPLAAWPGLWAGRAGDDAYSDPWRLTAGCMRHTNKNKLVAVGKQLARQFGPLAGQDR